MWGTAVIALVLKRIAGLLVTLLAVSFVLFALMAALPGDPAAIMLGTSASPDTLAALRTRLGLDQPLPLRYLAWLTALLHGDAGESLTYGVPVAGLIAERLTVTLPLAIAAVLLSVLIALPAGVLAARRHNRLTDMVVAVFCHAGIAIPGFWLGLLLIIVFSTGLEILPAGGFPGWSNGIGNSLLSLLLPAVALAIPQAAVLTRVTRAAMLDVLHEDYLRAARARGLGESTVIWRHGLPNAIIPVLTMLGLQFTFLIAGAVLVENVFNLPGMGRLAWQALTQRDLVVMQDVVLFFAALVIIVNFLVDLACLYIDPRLRKAAA